MRRGPPSSPNRFQSTRPLRGATVWCNFLLTVMDISIHAPLAGRDLSDSRNPARNIHFNPRAPCGARLRWRFRLFRYRHFNPRAPCGARRLRRGGRHGFLYFNPRAPCGARRHGDVRGGRGMAFQSTRPLRGATPCCQGLQHDLQISIHAPLAGRDVVIVPRSLQGYVFQSTRPLRGAT